jgi:hypothetical protein
MNARTLRRTAWQLAFLALVICAFAFGWVTVAAAY